MSIFSRQWKCQWNWVKWVQYISPIQNQQTLVQIFDRLIICFLRIWHPVRKFLNFCDSENAISRSVEKSLKKMFLHFHRGTNSTFFLIFFWHFVPTDTHFQTIWVLPRKISQPFFSNPKVIKRGMIVDVSPHPREMWITWFEVFLHALARDHTNLVPFFLCGYLHERLSSW